MYENGTGFNYLTKTFPVVSNTKISETVFVGPQMRGMIEDGKFKNPSSQVKKSAWKSLKRVMHYFSGNRKAPNYREIVDKLLQLYKDMGCNIFDKIHFLVSNLDFSNM